MTYTGTPLGWRGGSGKGEEGGKGAVVAVVIAAVVVAAAAVVVTVVPAAAAAAAAAAASSCCTIVVSLLLLSGARAWIPFLKNSLLEIALLLLPELSSKLGPRSRGPPRGEWPARGLRWRGCFFFFFSLKRLLRSRFLSSPFSPSTTNHQSVGKRFTPQELSHSPALVLSLSSDAPPLLLPQLEPRVGVFEALSGEEGAKTKRKKELMRRQRLRRA